MLVAFNRIEQKTTQWLFQLDDFHQIFTWELVGCFTKHPSTFNLLFGGPGVNKQNIAGWIFSADLLTGFFLTMG